MQTYKKDRIKTIVENPQNAQFFKMKEFHEDKGYTIVKHNDAEYFAVKTSHGMVYYELKGSVIGNYTNLFTV